MTTFDKIMVLLFCLVPSFALLEIRSEMRRYNDRLEKIDIQQRMKEAIEQSKGHESGLRFVCPDSMTCKGFYADEPIEGLK